jgi:hypothetical protein
MDPGKELSPVRKGAENVQEPTKLLLEKDPKPALKLGGQRSSLTDTDDDWLNSTRRILCWFVLGTLATQVTL